VSGHADYHPACGRALFGHNIDIAIDSPSAVLGGEAFLEWVFKAYRSMTSASGPNVWNTPLLIGWEEPGGTYDHVPPGPVPPPDPAAPEGEFGFKFDRTCAKRGRGPERKGEIRGCGRGESSSHNVATTRT
jgi:phospholipase C